MKHIREILFCAILFLSAYQQTASAQSQNNNIVDEVIWVVGDDAILKSDVEKARTSGERINGNPYCVIPEMLAVQKLFLHQAVLDSVEVADDLVNRFVDMQLQEWVMAAGSKEKLEEYRNQTYAQIRDELFDQLKDQRIAEMMREKLTEDIKVTPAQVRYYFRNIPADSLPIIPLQVEVELLAERPRIPQEEIDRIKNELRDYTERVGKGESFAWLARMYSEDGSASQGGELGFMGKGELDPAFANVAWTLQDTKKVSKIVESQYGYHIIQLIEKRGDKLNLRHILKRPRVDQTDVEAALARLDSIKDDILSSKFTFEDAAYELSDDKSSRANRGLMTNELKDDAGRIYDHTSRFQMAELPTEIARVVEGLDVGEISKPFTLIDPKTGKEMCAIVKLRSRIKAHPATITQDFQVLQRIVENKEKQDFLDRWIREKQRTTYIRINPDWQFDCDFKYPGWGTTAKVDN